MKPLKRYSVLDISQHVMFSLETTKNLHEALPTNPRNLTEMHFSYAEISDDVMSGGKPSPSALRPQMGLQY
jgi:hypothetical protein